MQRVLVLDINKNPLMSCTHAMAMILLSQNKADVFKTYPFTFILKILTKNSILQGINYHYCRLLQKNDAYNYSNYINILTKKGEGQDNFSPI
jgi:hypothetical protein